MLCLLLALAGAPGRASDKAEKPYALLFGTVFDANAHAVYGAHIKIRRADQKKPKWELFSDHSGEFAQRVPAGTADYVITAERKNGKALQTAGVKVHVE